jgi:hypothetical protein
MSGRKYDAIPENAYCSRKGNILTLELNDKTVLV